MTWAERFWALDQWLVQHQHLWRPQPFMHLRLLWETQYPDLAQWLRQQTLEQAESLDCCQAPVPFGDWWAQAQALTALPSLTQISVPPRLTAHFSTDIPGRKAQQIEAFAAHLNFAQPVQHWVDWCSGKGHLGRLLAQQADKPLTCLEYDAELVAAGAQLSQRWSISAQHIQQDVLAEGVGQHLSPESTPVALHACGLLHRQLLKQVVDRECQQMALAPCCYNRSNEPVYQPLSAQAQQAVLRLSAEDLRLPIRETVTAGARVRRQRDQSMAWRLAFDVVQRQLRQTDEYLSMPSVSAQWLHKPFAEYCQDLGALRGLSIPAHLDWNALEAQGWQRLAEVRNLERVRNLFRRPLELWLVLDQALFLEEQGYRVQLGTFCSPTLTPRNLLLLAERLN